ncbi:MAG: alpha/beta fold hydrolase [Bacteroidota bacterium]
MTLQTFHINATDGYQLSATRRVTEKERKGVIQMHCGTGIPQGVYHNLAAYLTEEGYYTITFDYRGIGASAPETLKGFEANMRDWGQKDMTGVFDWVQSEYPNDKKIVIGHSMGGQLIGMMANNTSIDQIVLIASSTGYWWDMSFPYKLMMPPLWFLFIPLTTSTFGYANAKKLRQGENLPKGVALEWRKWCINPNYFGDEFGRTIEPDHFAQVEAPIKAIRIADDPIANAVTANKILDYYPKSEVAVEVIKPSDLNVPKIGHTGFFSRKFKETLWKRLAGDLTRN